MTIGERIKQARMANRMSMRKLGGKAEISAMAISKYERDLDVPSSGVLLRLARALGVAIDYFFRPTTIEVQLHAYRKHSTLGIKEQNAILIRNQEWLERYLEVESFFEDEKTQVELTHYVIESADEVEKVAQDLRTTWYLGLDPIENLTQILEDHGIKVGRVDGFEHFDACTFMAGQSPVIVTKADLPGDRQRFNLGHELGHLVLEVSEKLDAEKISNRFVGAFLAPEHAVRFELGNTRTALDINELYLLKQKYGLSMQAWIFRARDLEIITPQAAEQLHKLFRANNWHHIEPGKAYPSEIPQRMEQLVYRALVEDLISRSKAQELLGKLPNQRWVEEALPDGIAISAGY
jgi:Zn-dependent peptidase ImmA (M78 family)/DNA-binding XRE family transcriptional regulator